MQYLVQDDLTKYLAALEEHLEHFLNDPTFVKAFHSGYLTRAKQDKRKMGEYKNRILGYLVSHAGSHASTNAQITLLDIVAEVPDGSKAQLLQPLIHELIGHDSSVKLDYVLAAALLRAFDSATTKVLNNEDSDELWQDFLKLLRWSRVSSEYKIFTLSRLICLQI